MIIFLFLLITAASLATFYKLKSQIVTQRKQIILLKYENNKLKHKLKNLNHF